MARKRAEKSEPQFEVSIEMVTPTMAANFLQGKAKNRRFHEQKTLLYAVDMEEDRWFLGDPITFNIEGQLVEGRHRMEAVVLVDKPVEFVVERNAPMAAMAVYGSGIPRSLADVLSMRDEMYCGDLAATVRYMWRWDRYHVLRPLPQTNREPTNQEAIASFAEHAEGFRDAVERGAQMYRVFVPKAIVASLWIIFSAIDSEDCEAFWENVVSASSEGPQPVNALKRRLVENKTSSTLKLPAFHIAALVIKTWNAWRDGKEVRMIVWHPGGRSPEPFPQPI